MLEELRIRGLGVISDAVLEFGPGLTVVTGETGAGKTMVLSGLGLLFGGRADYSRIRPGQDSASVDGRLTLPARSEVADVVAGLVAEAGGDLDDGSTVILRRVITAGGRSRAAAGGASVPASVLARIGETVIAVHGQSDQQRLAQPSAQRETLDRYAGIDLAEVREAYEAWRDCELELRRRMENARELEREADLLRLGVGEIDAAEVDLGEEDELEAALGRLQHADALRVAARAAHNALLGDAEDPTTDAADAQSLLGQARRQLGQVAGTDPTLDALGARVTELLSLVVDVGAELAQYELSLDADPARLAQLQDRRAVLNGLRRKYGSSIAEVLEWAAQARDRLARADTSDQALAELAAARDAARQRFTERAVVVSRRRTAAAAELSEAITDELAGLAMAGARVDFRVARRAAHESHPVVDTDTGSAGAGQDGIDEVALVLRSHPEAPELPIQRGASGGELSRVMLAIEVVLAGYDPVETMVFDEVDAGIGGKAASEVGKRLATLATRHQVIVVTHLAQVASFADTHLVVDKHLIPASTDEGEESVTRSDIRAVAEADRVGELARMLSGEETEIAREHAAELLRFAREHKLEAGRGQQSVRTAASKGRRSA